MEGHEGFSETVDTRTDGMMAHVRVASLDNRVIVDIDDLVEVVQSHAKSLCSPRLVRSHTLLKLE